MSRAKTPGSISRVASAREGKELRGYAPRSSQAVLKLVRRRDPVAILAQTDTGRVEALLPIRYGRMLQSPFAFLRGSAALMAFDLAHGPVSTIRVQACGDCHLMNFGAFATPERQLVFDLNDFDETLPAPFEWDVKRLAASIWVAGRYCRLENANAPKPFSRPSEPTAGSSQSMRSGRGYRSGTPKSMPTRCSRSVPMGIRRA